MMKTLAILSMLLLGGGVASAATAPGPIAAPTASYEDAADSLFQLARQAINDERYEHATSLLRQLVDGYPTSSKAGESLYWRAWAQYRLGVERRNKEYLNSALESIEQLQSKFPRSRSVS